MSKQAIRQGLQSLDDACAERRAEFERLSTRLARWMKKNCGEFVVAIVQDGEASLVDRHAERFSWDDYRAMTDVPEVDEAIRALLDDHTEDNATFVVRAIVEAAGHRLMNLSASKPGCNGFDYSTVGGCAGQDAAHKVGGAA